MSIEIRTERLVLRKFRLDDAAPFHVLMSNPEAMRFWATLPHSRLEETEAWVQAEMESGPAGDDFVVTLDGRVIGKCGCWRLPEVGLLFDPGVWGCGYASEALQGFIAHRRRLGSSKLVADVDPRNAASLRLLERCGFRETHRAERTWQLGGEWCDSVYLRLDLA